MPKTSKQTASHVQDMGTMEGRYEELGGYTVGFETFRQIIEFSPTEEYGRTMEVVGRNLATMQEA
jgi:hypothetical protein